MRFCDKEIDTKGFKHSNIQTYSDRVWSVFRWNIRQFHFEMCGFGWISFRRLWCITSVALNRSSSFFSTKQLTQNTINYSFSRSSQRKIYMSVCRIVKMHGAVCAFGIVVHHFLSFFCRNFYLTKAIHHAPHMLRTNCRFDQTKYLTPVKWLLFFLNRMLRIACICIWDFLTRCCPAGRVMVSVCMRVDCELYANNSFCVPSSTVSQFHVACKAIWMAIAINIDHSEK